MNAKPYYVDHEGNRFIPNKRACQKNCKCTKDNNGLLQMINNRLSINIGNTDHITTIQVHSHPSMLSEFIKRFYSKLINGIQNNLLIYGLLVPISNPKSEYANINWRLSYSFFS
jgi:hypothetical protein